MDLLSEKESSYLIKLENPMKHHFHLETNIFRSVKLRVFVRKISTGDLINEVKINGHQLESLPFEGQLAYEPLPFMQLNF